jgi:hypothetical protein
MQINVELKGVPETVDRLKGVQGGAKLALQQSILYALRRGRTAGARAARERYNVAYGWLLKAIGTPRMTGLTGFLHVSGAKAQLSMFPMRDIYPHGVAVQELKEGPPINLRHAFARQAKVYERETKETLRYPIRAMVGLSAPQMIAQRTEVFPKLQASMQQDLDKELERLIRLILSGGLRPK